MSRAALRHCVEVRHRGRLVASVVCGPDLAIGDGGRLVVPGVGASLELLRGGRIQSTARLAGEVRAADGVVEAWPDRESSVGASARLQVVAHPEIELTITPVTDGIAIDRTAVRMIPPRETVVAAGIAACLFAFFGHTASADVPHWRDREVEVEPESTAIVHAVFTAPKVEVVTLPPPVVTLPEPVAAPPLLANAIEPETIDRVGVDAIDEGHDVAKVEAPVVVAKRDDASKPRGRARRGRARQDARLDALLDSSVQVAAVMGDDEIDTLLVTGLGSPERPRFELRGADAGVVLEGTGTRGQVHDGAPAVDAPGEAEPAPPSVRMPEVIESDEVPSDGPGGVAPEIVAVEAAAPPPDPRRGKFSLDDALAGRPDLASDQGGDLVARLHTSKGVIDCELFDDRAPVTVANFVGLALGTRESFDRAGNRWRKAKLYDGTIFHRVVKGFVVQGGDPDGKGSGGPGYTIADEIVTDLHHDAAGVLSMANRGPDTGGSQFFITLGGARHIDGTSTIFGRCDVAVPLAIGDVPVDATHRPSAPVTLERVEIVRRVAEPETPKPDAPAPAPDVDVVEPAAPVDPIPVD